MIIHLSPGSGSVELHIHDNAQVALYQAGDRPALLQTNAPWFRQPSRLVAAAVMGTLCVGLGFIIAPPGSATPGRGVGPAPIVRPIPSLPSNIPLVPDASSLPRYEEPAVAVPTARPHAGAEPADGVPSAVVRQLAQPPVVVPPSAPARPATAGSAFGLEN